MTDPFGMKVFCHKCNKTIGTVKTNKEAVELRAQHDSKTHMEERH